MGIEAGLIALSPETSDLEPISDLLAKAEGTREEWFSVPGINAPSPSSLGEQSSVMAEITDREDIPLPTQRPIFVPPNDLALVDTIPTNREGIPALPTGSVHEEPAEMLVDKHDPVEAITPRPQTSGKCLKELESAGLLVEPLETVVEGKRKRVILKVKAQKPGSTAEGGGDELAVNPKRRRRKERKVVSAAMVDSEGDGGAPKPKRTGPSDDSWDTARSPATCVPCAVAEVECRSYVPRSRGHPRFACCRCHLMKKMCDFTKARKLARAKERGRTPRARPAAAEDGSKSRGKGRFGNNDTSSSDEQDEDEEASETKRQSMASRKGKGKAKRRLESRKPEDKAVKLEEDEDFDWMMCEWILFFLLYVSPTLFSGRSWSIGRNDSPSTGNTGRHRGTLLPHSSH